MIFTIEQLNKGEDTMSILSQRIGNLAEKVKTPRLQGSVSVLNAVKLLDAHKSDILGVECEEEFAGIFTRGGYNRMVARQNLEPEETTLYEVMTLNPPYVCHDLSIKETYNAMLAYQWEHMPVLRDARLLGIVSLHDLSQNVLQSFETAEQENEMMLKYIRHGEAYSVSNH